MSLCSDRLLKLSDGNYEKGKGRQDVKKKVKKKKENRIIKK